MTPKRVAILIAGGGSNMVSLVEAMADVATLEPVLVFSNNPDAVGLRKAEKLGIETAIVDHRPFKGDRDAFEEKLHEALLAAQPDIICLAGFMRILNADFIKKWEGRMLNIHPSLLPLFKGLHTHQRALDSGVAIHGCTVHEVSPELDGGRILGQAAISVSATDTAETLAARLLPLEHRLYPMVLKKFATGDKTPTSILGA